MATVEEQMAKLEGAFEQINTRLSSLEATVTTRLGALEGEIRSNFRWLLGTQLTMWITIIAAILFKP